MRSSLYSAKVRQAPAISTRVLGNLASSSLSAEDRNYKNRNRVRSCWHRTHSEVTNQIDLSQINERTNMGTKQLSGRRKAGRSRAASQSVSQSVSPPRFTGCQTAKRSMLGIRLAIRVIFQAALWTVFVLLNWGQIYSCKKLPKSGSMLMNPFSDGPSGWF